jgi:hypothetical protein
MSLQHLEGFIEGFEVLKLRTDKLRKSAQELDQVVSRKRINCSFEEESLILLIFEILNSNHEI